MEGTVQISIEDFESLRSQAKLFQELRSKLYRSTFVNDIETSEGSDQWIQVITVDVEIIANIAADYSDVEERYPEDRILLKNVNLDAIVD